MEKLALTALEQLILEVFRRENVGPNEHVNYHRLTKHVNFSAVSADELNQGFSDLCAKGLLAPGHHQGFIQLTAVGHRHL